MIQPNTVVGRHYRIVSQLGTGGMSQVYKAVDLNLGREVALKFLHPESAGEKDLVQRFLNEGRILATIKHRAVIDVYASDTDETVGSPFLVMELVDGLTLEAAENTLRGDLPRLLQLFVELLEGIHACHQKGIIHRDLKPANVLINRAGQLKIVDFGVAKTARKVTRTGMTLGTPHYMAPEQCLGKGDITPAADIYSIGIMFWEMLAGKVPFDVESGATDPALTIALKHLNEAVPIERISEDPRTAPFAELLRGMLAKKPEERPTVPDIIEQLKRQMKVKAPGEATSENDPDLIGEIYRIERVLGQGGMGTVYKALDTALNRPVAIKMLNQSISSDERIVERFLKEGQLLATVGHPNVLSIYASARDRTTGRPFLVMEYIDGKLLSDLKKTDGLLDHRRIVPLMLQLMDGIRACHQKGIIHRDLKPTNLMVTRDGTLKIFDFGIAKTEAAMTRVGMTLGTPQYMSPEQCTGSAALTPASDVYSIGIVLWEMIFGAPPFIAENESNPELSIALKQVQGTLPMPALPADQATAALVPMIRRMLDKQPTERPTTDEIITLLDEHLKTYPVEGLRLETARRRDSLRRSTAEGLFTPEEPGTMRMKLFGGLLAALLLGGLVFWWAGSPKPPLPPTEDQEIAALNRRIAENIATGKLPEAVTDLGLLARKPGVAAQVTVFRTSLCAALVKRGNDLIALGDLSGARALLQHALNLEPANRDALEAFERASAPPAHSASQAPASAPPDIVPVASSSTPEPPAITPPEPVEAPTAPEPAMPAPVASAAPASEPEETPAPANQPVSPASQTVVEPPAPQNPFEAPITEVSAAIDAFSGEASPTPILEKIGALETLAGAGAVKPLKLRLAAKLAAIGDVKLDIDKRLALQFYEQAIGLDPEQPGTRAKIGLARSALESEKAAAAQKSKQDQARDRASLVADAEKAAKTFKPGFTQPRPLIAKLRSLAAEDPSRASELTREIRDRYIKAATARSATDPHGALRLLKQITGFPGMKNDPQVTASLADISAKARAAAPEKPAPEPQPAPPSDAPDGEPVSTPADEAPVTVTPSETGGELSQLTQPEVVGRHVDRIIQLCRDLEKKKRRDEAAAYRAQAVENLIDNAEENSANGAIDAAIVDYDKALRIIPNHAGALAGKKFLLNLGKSGGTIDAAEETAPQEPGQ
ncbi:MAG TPA: protein kinase [Candidatus Ozemobacteraceae bacterium]|nr:protein kinase [Candidatus Ozemobacteraceae bacterium]